MKNLSLLQLATLKEKYKVIEPYLNEKSRRIWAASEAKSIGRNGKKLVKDATGLSYDTIRKGTKELSTTQSVTGDSGNSRCAGGGRKNKTLIDINLISDIKDLIESSTRGDPEAPLLWCSKSTRHIADEINKDSTRISHTSVAKILDTLGYSLQSNRKVLEGSNHIDRDAQFNFINEKVKLFQANNNPVISVDTKKKENIGEFKNSGQEYHIKGAAPKVNVYDFIDKTKGKAAPYGVYDISKNTGWVSVGISSDTAEFAVNSIRCWWNEMGKTVYQNSAELYINADGGGSNGSRVRLWKIELQKLATEIDKIINVSHFPPGTSKWNKIEHKMFCFISKNWRGRPLMDSATIVQLIANTTNKNGLKIMAKLDDKTYQKAIQITDTELEKINLEKDEFHGEWNYKILPQK